MPFQESHLNRSNLPVGVMDTDSDLTAIAQQNARYALNIRNGRGSIVNAATPVKGNVLVDFALPDGDNVCIGTHEDLRGESCVYFIANSLGNHQILRYYPNSPLGVNGEIQLVAQGAALNFNADWLITHISLVDGRMLYWTDAYTDKQEIVGNPPRMLNIERSNRNKRLTYNVYAGLAGQGQFSQAVVNNTTLTFQFYNKATGAPTAQVAVIPASILQTLANDPEAILDYVADVINTLFPVFASAEFCDCKTTIEVREDLTLDIFETNNTQRDLLFVADNHYPSPLQEHHIDLIKYPPVYEPTPTYQRNDDLPYNNVNRSLFQFRARYWYYDNEKSAWGPISLVALNLEQDGQILDNLNEILVDFTEPRLNDPSFLAMIKYVEIGYRIGNNDIFRSLDKIRVCEIGINIQYILFRNDKLYSAIPSDDVVTTGDVQALKLFDSVPILTGTMENVADREGNSRLFCGANLENYDCPDCIEMDFQTDVEPPDDCLFTITGKVYVDDIVFDITNTLPPTFSPATSPLPSPNPNNDVFRFPNMVLDGFVIYLAGVNRFGVSDNPKDGSGTGDFTIGNVSKGIYILRVASHICRFNDDLGDIYNLASGNLQWQKTSTYTYMVGGVVQKEIIIDLTSVVGNTYDMGEIRIISPSSRNVNRGAFVPPDPRATTWYSVFPIYLRDNQAEIDSPLTDYAIRKGAIGVEGQRLNLFKPSGVGGGVITSPMWEPGRETDHNGFGFIYFWNDFSEIGGDIPGTWFTIRETALQVEVCDVASYPGIRILTLGGGGGQGLYPFLKSNPTPPPNTIATDSLTLLEEEDLDMVPPFPADFYSTGILGLDTGIYFNDDQDFTEQNKTRLEGQVVDSNGLPKPNVLIAFQRNGRQEFTGVNGFYSISIYCPFDFNFRSGNLIATYPLDNCYTHPLTDHIQNLVIGDFLTNYTQDIPFTAPLITMDISVGILDNSRYLKRGASYKVGMVYEDRANRKCTVSEAEQPLYIPYFNEVGEIAKPTALWSISHLPPEWATHYRIVRSRNTVYRRYFQWVLSNVLYVKIATPQATPETTTYDNADATHILLDLGSITNADPSTNPVLFFFNNGQDGAYQAEPLDRVRFITDEEGVVLTSLLEMEVEGQYIENDRYYLVIKDPELLREIKQGSIVEVYSPKSVQEVAFYECGETYPILNPHTPNRAHGGQTQDQIPGITPAQGYFKGGDTYWRIEDFSVSGQDAISQILEHNYTTSRFPSQADDIGRVNLRDDSFVQAFYHNKIRFSQIYLTGTLINGLSSFLAIDNQNIDQRHGIIKRLILADMVMLAIAQNKIQPIYVSKDLILDLKGSSDVGRTDKIVNLAEPLKLDLGTNNPESIIEENGTVYGWDVAKGVMWRYSVNGLFPISSYGQTAFFSDLGKRLYKQPRIRTRVFGGYEREFGAYLATFVADGVEILQPFTVSFDEEKNGWNQYLSFTPQYYGRIGKRVVSFVDGKLWLHESDQVPMNNFYGQQYTSIWEFVCNHAPKAVKIAYNIEQQADNLWYCSLITTPPNNDYAQGMRSRIPANRWSRTEGVWKADFLRDMNDTQARFLSILDPATRDFTALLYGRPLRGEVFVIRMELLDGSKMSILKRIDVEHNLSMDTKV